MKPKSLTLADKLLLAFTALLVINTFTHDWHNSGPGQPPIIQHLINGYFIPLVLYFTAKNANITEGNLGALQVILICFGVYLSVTAILETQGAWSLVFPKYIADPTRGIHFGRARGPYLQSARLGMYLVTCFVATWLILLRREKWGRPGQLLAVLLCPLYVAACYFTYTRSVWMGIVVASFTILWFSLDRRPRKLIVGSMLAATILAVVVHRDALVSLKRESAAADTRESTYMRASFAYVSWQMFKERPLQGYGFGQFSRENRPFLSDRAGRLRLEAIRGYVHHNTLLSVLVELGILGLILYAGVFLAWIRQAWMLWQETSAPLWMRTQGLFFLALMGPYMVQLLFRDVSYSPVENGNLLFHAGLMSGLASMCHVGKQRTETSDEYEMGRRGGSVVPAEV